MDRSLLKKSRITLTIVGAVLIWGCSGPSETPQQEEITASSYMGGGNSTAPREKADLPAQPTEDPAPEARMLNLFGTMGFASLKDAFERFDGYPWTKQNPKPLYFTRELDGEEGLGVSWLTAPWSGKTTDPLIFPATFEGTNLKVRLTLNGKSLIEFNPTDSDETQSWEHDGSKLDFIKIGVWQGVHGVFVLHLAEKAAKANEALELGFKILEADEERAWIGIRDAKNGVDF